MMHINQDARQDCGNWGLYSEEYHDHGILECDAM